MTKYLIIFNDGSCSAYYTEKHRAFADFCAVYFERVCQFPYEVEQIMKLNGETVLDLQDFDSLTA